MHVALIDPSRVVLKIVSKMLIAGGRTDMALTDSGEALAHANIHPAVTCVLTSLELKPIYRLELYYGCYVRLPAPCQLSQPRSERLLGLLPLASVSPLLPLLAT